MSRFGIREREDKSVLTAPLCPFCRECFLPPAEVSTTLGFFSGGVCSKCGAVYVYDASSKNMGEAFMDALVYACKEDWDYAMSLEAGKGYDDVYMSYVERNHSISIKQAKTFYEKMGNMVFVKLRKLNDF
ncbi:MAG: hypothetical protein L3V56_00785 [Candidatus Magnetoovum sp. WYHC-5]|nr:hypothetical protein [Candidatus Magnetoovum sp. WYHC-5]